MVSGKGGVGKSTTALALALIAAQNGRDVILAETSPEFALQSLVLEPGQSPADRFVLKYGKGSITFRRFLGSDNFREYIGKYLGLATLFQALISNRFMMSLINFLPGVHDLLLLGRLYYEADLQNTSVNGAQKRLVIFDCPASGHFLQMLRSPAALLTSRLVGPIIADTQRVKSFISDVTKVAVMLVSIPSDLAQSELNDVSAALSKEHPGLLAGCILNRYWPQEGIDAATTGNAPRVSDYVTQKCRASQECLKSIRSQEVFKDKIGLTLMEFGTLPEPRDLAHWHDGLLLSEQS